MGDESKSAATVLELHQVAPREVTGRDVIERFQVQFRAAGLACLRILEGKSIDRVFCDFHDDYVVREIANGAKAYHFVQVKTKNLKKHQWNRLELFGLPKRLPKKPHKNLHFPGGQPAPSEEECEKITNSFIGKLLIHTANFKDACASITFETNVHFDEDVEDIEVAIRSAEFNEPTLRYIADNYAAICGSHGSAAPPEIQRRIGLLRLSGENHYLHPHGHQFEMAARQAIFDRCEVDLTHIEGVELAVKLLGLVQKKSSARTLHTMSTEELELTVSVGIDDLLALLPISLSAYRALASGGDKLALKNASILQRKLGKASPGIVDAASRWKVEWDSWVRTYRHLYEVDLAFLQNDLNAIYAKWASGHIAINGLKVEISALIDRLEGSPLKPLLSETLLLGGIMSELVRSEAR